MPELPEVETLRRELARILIGKTFQSGKIFWSGTIKPLSPKQFLDKVVGQKIKKVERRAKVLLFELEENHLAIHLKMTGQLIYVPKHGQMISGGHPQQNAFNYTRVIFNLDDGSKLFFNDLRKFGWVRILSADHKKILLEKHGVEPLSPQFTLEKFLEIIKRYPNRRLKQTLLDQSLIAGLGNIYVDESCSTAGLRPARPVKTLTDLELKKLYCAIKKILKLSIKKGGTSSKNYVRSDGSRGGFATCLKVYGRGGEPCKRCSPSFGKTDRPLIQKIKLAGRGTHYCPKCQK